MGITKVIVRHEDFDVSREMEELRKGSGSAGAMVAFTGVVRNRNQGDDIFALTLEHYPGMTESSITAIADATGFSSIYLFCSTFKAALGLTPTQFRKHFKNQGSGG